MPRTSVGLEPFPSHFKSPSPSCLLCILNPVTSQYLTFGCAGSLLLRRLFSSWGERGLLASYGAPAPRRTGFSCGAWGLGTWARSCGSMELHWLSCSTARGMVRDHGSNPCLLHWQDSQPLSRQGSLLNTFKQASTTYVSLPLLQ